ncbi:20846_t:CDS:1 [Cetraspora pellucida]|uniref:20846_t:CDS:1 n=1 Tax=Cetraspora pellucida TaxID=1433469 RepID=A0A9N9FTD4_9GLOM|nr:20846_t:CDS:1 [Cetraspora pellucida]
MESKCIYLTFTKTYIDTNIVELKHVFITFDEVHINNSTVELECTIGTFDCINNSFVDLVHIFKTHIDSSIVKSECTFATFAKACATIKRYTAQTNTVIILDKMTRNSDNSCYRQALFVYKKQEKYNKTNDVYITKCTGCSFAISINYCKHV